MSYSSQDLVSYLYPNERIAKMQWMIDDLECYASQTGAYLGWQITLKNRHFLKRGGRWIEVDDCGKIVLRQMVA